MLFCFLLLTRNVFAQPNVTIWSEDFTGCLSFPTEGKNASYSWESSYGKEPSVEYPSYVGNRAPSLLIPENTIFIAKIPLYGAYGEFTLSFNTNNVDNIEVTTTNKKASVTPYGKKYKVAVQKGMNYLTLCFSAIKKNVRIDDLLLSASADCRDGKPIAPVSFEKDTVTIILGEAVSIPELVNPDSLKIAYWSSDKTIATVDDNGNVVPRSLGSATISAIFTGDEKYSYSEASYVFHVDRRVPDDEVYYEDFSNCLALGGNENTASRPSGVISSIKTDNKHTSGAAYQAYKCAYLEEDHNLIIDSIDALDGKDGVICFLVKSKGKSGSDGKVAISGGGKIAVGTFSSEYGKWKLVTIPFTNAKAGSVFTITGDKLFIDSVSITAIPKNINLRVSSVGYASMFYSKYALRVPIGVNAYTMRVDDGKVDDSHRYASGDVIPKATAVIIKAAKGDYDFEVVDEEGFDDSVNNHLRGSDYEELTTGGDKYYMLAAPEGNPVGFYRAAKKGGAFLNGAHKAYLAVTFSQVASPAKNYPFNFTEDTSTKINKYLADREEVRGTSDVCYNAFGQRVDLKTYKGIVIRNGKKFIKR